MDRRAVGRWVAEEYLRHVDASRRHNLVGESRESDERHEYIVAGSRHGEERLHVLPPRRPEEEHTNFKSKATNKKRALTAERAIAP